MTAPEVSGPVRELFGIPVAALTMEEVLRRVDRAVRRRERLHIGVVNAAKVVNMRRDAALRADVLSSDLILADGASVVWASRLLGRPLPERLAGIDVMLRLLEVGRERGYRVYCLGASEEVLLGALARLAAQYPGLSVVGSHHGYFTAEEEPSVAAGIARSRPDVLFVAMSSPRKERFLARWSGRLGVPVCHGVGGSFDVLAGKVRRAPLAWQRLGLEWLYRVRQEPRRLWRRYLVTNTLFCGMVARELWRGARAAAGQALAGLRARRIPGVRRAKRSVSFDASRRIHSGARRLTTYSAERSAPHPGPGADVEPLRVSVVIPTFNRAALLGRAVESAFRAVAPTDEIIVVDDGSTDGTAEVLAPYGDGIRYLRQPHGGAGRARNRGIAEAKHPLVAFLDSDDEWMPDHLELGRRLLQARPDLLFCFSDFLSHRFDGAVRRFRLSSWHKDPRSWEEILGEGFPFSSVAALPAGRADFHVYAGDLYPSLLKAPYVPTITALVRRGAAGGALHFPEDLPVYEDWECFARLARGGRTAYLACETAVNWGHQGARLTGADPVVLATARIRLQERVWGTDHAFLGQQGREYRRVLHGERLALSRWLFRQGHTRAAGRQAALAGRRGLAYRALGLVPGPMARASLAALDRLIARARGRPGTTGGPERARSLQGPHAGG